MTRIVAIVNPCSASGQTGRLWPSLHQRLEASFGGVDFFLSSSQGEASELTRQALYAGAEQIIAVGGDGTLNEVVNGFFVSDSSSPQLIQPKACLSLIMQGTGGDFRRSLGMDNTLDDYIQRLSHGEVRSLDIGRITWGQHQRYFFNIAGFGMGGEVVRNIEEQPLLKSLGGKLGFLGATLFTLVHYQNKKVKLILDDEFGVTLNLRQGAVCNGQFQGGGMQMAPMAQLDDGYFDLVLLEGIGRLRSVFELSKVYRGSHIGASCIRHLKVKKVEILPLDGQGLYLDIDGEGPVATPATLEVLPRILKVKF